MNGNTRILPAIHCLHFADSFPLSSSLQSKADLDIGRFTGFIQDNIALKGSRDVILQAGLRYNYNTLNHEFLLSPRLGLFLETQASKKRYYLSRGRGNL